MAYTRRGNVRRQHRDSKSLIPKRGSGSGSGNKKRMAKADLKTTSLEDLKKRMEDAGVDGTNYRIKTRDDE